MTTALALASVNTFLNQVIECDALTLLNSLPAACLDMVLTDMPYGVTACAWDKRPDLAAWWIAVKRVVKPRAAIVCTAIQPFTSMLVMSNLKWFRYEWVWEKKRVSGFLNANKRPLSMHESILVFWENTGRYYPQMTIGKIHPRGSSNGGKASNYREHIRILNEDIDYFPRSVLSFGHIPVYHPNEKPVALFEYLIRTYTRPGDLVCDPYVGSGTTALAARNCGRHFICGDLSPEYVKIARDRLAQPYTLPMFEQTSDPVAAGVKQLALFAEGYAHG